MSCMCFAAGAACQIRRALRVFLYCCRALFDRGLSSDERMLVDRVDRLVVTCDAFQTPSCSKNGNVPRFPSRFRRNTLHTGAPPKHNKHHRGRCGEANRFDRRCVVPRGSGPPGCPAQRALGAHHARVRPRAARPRNARDFSAPRYPQPRESGRFRSAGGHQPCCADPPHRRPAAVRACCVVFLRLRRRRKRWAPLRPRCR